LIDNDETSRPDASLRQRFEAAFENSAIDRRDNDRYGGSVAPRDISHGRGAASNSSKRITASTPFAAGQG
jgi:hypothetical protein